jgi:predicted glycosyltransferase
MTRVLFYVQHLLGVGHVKRAAAIARAAAAYGHEVLVVLGGEPVPHVDFGKARTHQLPQARAADQRFSVLLDADGVAITDAWKERRRTALLDVAERFAPNAVLLEHYPFGRRVFSFELTPLLARWKPQAKIAASVRDVLVERDDPAKADRIVSLARQLLDAVLVHGDSAVIPFAATFPRAAELADLIQYTGYVVDGPAAKPTANNAAGDGRDEIIVSVGGGAVGQGLLDAAIAAAQAGTLSPRRWRLLAGRNLGEPIFAALQARLQPDGPVILEWARPDFRDLLARSALSISQGGYNTLMDILVAGCPALIVPFMADGESEQLFRAREFERRGRIAVLPETELSATSLALAATKAFNMPVNAVTIARDGARRTAELLDQLVTS